MVSKKAWWSSREWQVKWSTYWKGKIKSQHMLIVAKHRSFGNTYPYEHRLYEVYIADNSFDVLYPVGTFTLSDLKELNKALNKLVNTIIKDEVSGKEPDEFVKEV